MFIYIYIYIYINLDKNINIKIFRSLFGLHIPETQVLLDFDPSIFLIFFIFKMCLIQPELPEFLISALKSTFG